MKSSQFVCLHVRREMLLVSRHFFKSAFLVCLSIEGKRLFGYDSFG